MTSANSFSWPACWPCAPQRPLTVLLPVVVLGFHALTSQAQPVDAGSLRQQIEQQRELPLPPPVRAPRAAPPPEIQPRSGVTVQVKALRFAGNTLLTAEQLAPAVSGFVERTLGFEELQRAADAVAAAYTEAGWIARVYLPEQDISEGVVTLQVVEAHFGGVRREGEPSQRVQSAELEAYFRSRQAEGEPLNATRLDRALLLADDLPGVSVAGTLAPGNTDGETALVLQTTDEPLVYGDVSVDNTGSRSTGSERLSVNLNVNSPGGRGELLAVNLLHTRGSDYARVGLTVPMGYDGLRLGANVSDMKYSVVTGSAATGSSSSMGLDLSYPLVRARMNNLYLSAGVEDKRFYNFLSVVQSDYRSDSLRVGLSGNWFDGWGGGGANSMSLQGLQGRLGSMLAHSAKDTIERGYRKLTYGLTRQQSVSEEHSVYLSLSGQYAAQMLDSSERFFVGGISSVRAYPVSEQGGDRGQALSGEWRWRLGGDWVLTAFADLGRVQSLAPKVNPGDGEPVTLRGRGLSVSWRGPMGLSTKLTWAHRNGGNPKPTAAGTDSDGTFKKDRLWFNASLPF